MSQTLKLPHTSLQVEMLNNKIFNQQTTKTMSPVICDEITTQFVLDKLRKHEDQNTEINQKLLILQDILKKQVETLFPLNFLFCPYFIKYISGRKGLHKIGKS